MAIIKPDLPIIFLNFLPLPSPRRGPSRVGWHKDGPGMGNRGSRAELLAPTSPETHPSERNLGFLSLRSSPHLSSPSPRSLSHALMTRLLPEHVSLLSSCYLSDSFYLSPSFFYVFSDLTFFGPLSQTHISPFFTRFFSLCS